MDENRGQNRGENRGKIAALSPDKLEMFARKLAERRTRSGPREIPARPRDGRPVPLSFAQQRLWFLFQLDRESTAYNIVNFLPLDVPRPDFAAMRRSLEEVVRRHEILRTTYTEGDEPTQVVHPSLPVELAVVDLSRLPRERFEPEAVALLARDNERPFDLATGPLLRSLVLVSGERVYWGFAYHHIVSDWWSATIFYREVMHYYELFAGGSGASGIRALPEPRLQYADFAVWERERLTDAALAPLIDFFRERLGETPPVLDLPTDRPRPAVRSGRGGEVVTTLPAETMTPLRRFIQGEGATPFMMLLAGLGLLLHRYSGQDRVTVGSAISNREHPDLQEILGFFVNTLVFANDLGGDPPFREALARVKASCLETFARQELPFEKLVAALAPQREVGRNPLFEVIFALEKDFSISERVAEEKVSRHERAVSAKFDLTWQLVEETAQTTVKLEYSADLFDRGTIERLLGHYRNLIDAAIADPEARLSALPLMAEAERRQVVEEWNRTAAPYPRETGVAALFDAWAAARPDAPALLYDSADGPGEVVTYGELAAAADRLGHALLARGVRRGERVALLLERSTDLVTAMLGVLKAGAAYVPLDPGSPPERVAFMLAESAARRVLFQERTRDRLLALPGVSGLETIAVEEEMEVAPGAFPGEVGGEDLAYVMYTSGSTGKPKGIAIPHGAIVRLVRESDYVRLGPGDRVAQISNTAFDATTFEIWGALLNGAAVVGIDREVALDPERFAAWIEERAITSLFLTTALFNLVADRAPAAFRSVREVLFGGQACDPRPVRRVLEAGGPGRLLHVYGPTESTTFATWDRIAAPPAEQEPVPIGQPLRNTTAYVVDRHLRVVPAGIPGELVLGGDGLAQGYVERPAATAEVFLPDPWSATPGARLYRTGDLVRRLPDGRIVFLGRRDHQVKIRGFRIEPGEIEAALQGHPSVQAAVVLTPADERGERRLVAYVEPAAEEEVRTESLRAWLAEKLPDYMIPAAWMVVDRFPLTPSGKIDRRALPDPGEARAGAGSMDSYVAPREGLETALAELWERFLGNGPVGAHGDFFVLGGHSLLATQVVSRIREELGIPLALRDFFEAPTPALLAARLSARGLTGVARGALPIPRADRAQPLPLSFAQQRLWFLHQLEPASAAYNMPEAVTLEAPVDVAALERALTTLAERHEALRTRFAAVAGRPVQVIDPPAPFPLRHEDLRSLPEAEREAVARRLLAEEARQPFDLAAGPLIRALLVTVDGDRQVLLLNLHHVISDGWSLRLLARELRELYAALRAGETAPPLPPLPIQYADFAVWQRRFLSGAELDRQLGYWKERLSGALPTLELPADFPRPPVQSFAGAVTTLELDEELVAGLERLGRSAGATLFMTLLAGFAAVLSRFSGQTDLIVGSPIANRNRAEIEGVVGFFVNTLALRLDLADDPGFAALVERVREVTLGAYDHQDLPFEMLVDAVRPERDLSRNPIFQVLFDFHTDLDPAMLPVAGEPSLGEVEIENAICDLSVSAFEVEGRVLLGAQYSTALFRRETIDRLLAACRHLLSAAVERSEGAELPVSRLPLLSADERRRLLGKWSTRPPVGNLSLSLPELLARRLAESPEEPAVIDGERRVSFAELDRLTRHLAGRLVRAGVGRETRVAVCLGRSPEMVAALLAVLGAGGAYVPLDPADPAERLRFLLDDAAPRLLLVDRTTAPAIAALGPLPVEVLGLEQALARAEEREPAVEILLEQLAYAIYTSGSTGLPKGAMISHRALSGFAQGIAHTLELGPGDRVLQFATLSFDVTVEEIFPTLLAGATVVLAPGIQQMEPAAFTGFLREAGITGFEVPTHFWGEWVADLERRGERPPETLRYVATGTERVPPERLAAWERWGVPLVHVYGLTEVTCTSLTERFEGGSGDGALPIGRPEPGTRVYLLDREMQPVPVGVAGEIHLGGSGLARGYLRRPDLTAARFVPDPFAEEPGSRLYRTGDLGRFLDDGRVVFLGRVDTQLKIRGFRIEPGEVEAALRRVPGVREAVVAARGETSATRRLVAWVVLDEGAEMPTVGTWRRLLGERLPEPMIPAAFVALGALPVASTGKVDLLRLPAPEAERPRLESAYAAPQGELERAIAGVWQEVLGIAEVGLHDNFFELGGNSLLIVQVHSRLRDDHGLTLSLVDLFAAPTVQALADLAGRQSRAEEAAPPELPARDSFLSGEVAVIAMNGRFSGTRSLEAFWDNLRNGVDSVSRFTDEEMLAAGLDAETLARPDFVKAKGILPEADRFDAPFFGLPPRDAEILDPQHRVFLEAAWEALELAGYDARQYHGRIGVYAGCSPGYYFRENLFGNPAVESVDPMKIDFGNVSDFLPLRVSYLLDLDGPSVNVQSACSTSLTAIGEAYFSVLSGQCDMALAGGVTVLVPQVAGYFFHEANIWSRDGRCRSFDAEASGLVVGEGVGIVVLKRLADALADGDQIHAVIRGASIRNEGAAKVGFAAPGVEGQVRMVREAIERSGIDPRTIGLVEAHGSATLLGDPAEVAGLTRAFRTWTRDSGFCALGSVKSNIGHADIAAGVAGFLKAALALRDKVIPPSLHFETPNPALDLESSPFFVPTRLLPWEETGHPRRAGVSSIGVGGTNTHLILEEVPPVSPGDSSPRAGHLLPLSARTPTALVAQAERLAAHLRDHPDLDLADVAATLQRGRRALEHRRFVVAGSLAEAAEALRNDPRPNDPRPILAGQVGRDAKPPEVVFLCAGQGAESPGMGRGLYRSEPVFRDVLERGAALLGEPIDAIGVLDEPRHALSALFLVSWGLAELWRSWGIEPRSLVGHGTGEIVAACVSGVMSFEDGLRLTALRGRLAESLPPGAALTVNLPAAEVEPLLPSGAWLAANNGLYHCTVAGTPEAIAALEADLARRGADCRRSDVPHPATLEPLREDLLTELRRIELRPPRIPLVSSRTGDWITDGQATDPTYWVEQMTSTVRFSEALARVLSASPSSDNPLCLLEIGPGRTLTTLARHQADRKRPPLLLTSLRPPREEGSDDAFLMQSLGRLWLAGAAIDWQRVQNGGRRLRVSLPTYPFERQRYWIDPPDRSRPALAEVAAGPVLRKRSDVARWFYAPSWQRAPRPTRRPAAGETWLLFLDRQGLGEALARELETRGQTVYTVRAGVGLAEIDERVYTLHPERPDEYAALFEELASRGAAPHHLVHLWNVTAPEDDRPPRERFLSSLPAGYLSLLYLVRAIDALPGSHLAPPRLTAVASELHEVIGDEAPRAEKAALLGVCRVLSQEHPHLECRAVDVVPPPAGSPAGARLATQLIAECLDPGERELVVAHRNGYRYAQRFAPVPLGAELDGASRFREGGVYLMTGGQGWLGFELGALLAGKYRARLALLGRETLPPREEWDARLAASQGEMDKTAWKIRQVRRLEEKGAEILLLTADAADRGQMERAFAATEERFGRIDGVLHAAGITDESHYHPIRETTAENGRYHFAPKVEGLFVLEELLADRPVDFCLVFSSIAAILGGLGFVNYTAANAVMDVHVESLNRRSPVHWVSVAWDGWLIGEIVEEAARAEEGSLLSLAMTMEEGLLATERILARPDLGRVAVSTGDLDLRIDRWVRLTSPAARAKANSKAHTKAHTKENPKAPEGSGAAASAGAHERPHLSNAYEAPRNELEGQIAAIWQDLLGVGQVGVHDNFFELGGDSLLAVHLSSKLLRQVGVEMSAGLLLGAQTVAEQAVAVVRKIAEEAGEDLDALLAETTR